VNVGVARDKTRYTGCSLTKIPLRVLKLISRDVLDLFNALLQALLQNDGIFTTRAGSNVEPIFHAQGLFWEREVGAAAAGQAIRSFALDSSAAAAASAATLQRAETVLVQYNCTSSSTWVLVHLY
jgi:hypothetical protein